MFLSLSLSSVVVYCVVCIISIAFFFKLFILCLLSFCVIFLFYCIFIVFIYAVIFLLLFSVFSIYFIFICIVSLFYFLSVIFFNDSCSLIYLRACPSETTSGVLRSRCPPPAVFCILRMTAVAYPRFYSSSVQTNYRFAEFIYLL